MVRITRLSALDVAEYFLYLDSQPDRIGERISPLKLQKLVYYAQGFSLALRGEPLFAEAIKAWDHGPIVPTVYHRYKEYGGGPIPAPAGIDLSRFDTETTDVLGLVYMTYGRYTAWALREITHAEEPYTQTPQNDIIGHDALREYFTRTLAPATCGTAGRDGSKRAPGQFTARERERVLQAAVASEALEGYNLPYNVAARALEEVLQEPLPKRE